MKLHTGLVGRAIQASRSPWLHEQEAAAQGLELDYTLFDFTQRNLADAELGPLLRRLAGEGYCGVNVTYPFKQAVIPLLDDLGDCAISVGAVNTVAMREGRLTGYNTDKTGFEESLRAGLPDADLGAVLLLGAGGAGSAVANALLTLGTQRLHIADLDTARAEALATRLCAQYGAGRAAAQTNLPIDTGAVQGIVNSTPMGMAAQPQPAIDPALILPQHWVADVVYFPLETELLRQARAKGCRTLDGSGMVIAQAAHAFQIFTGYTADKPRMRESFAAA